MLLLYVGWRLLRRVWLVMLGLTIAGVVLIAHPQKQLRQAIDGRGAIGHRLDHLERNFDRGLERHLRPPDGRPDHPPRVKRSGSR